MRSIASFLLSFLLVAGCSDASAGAIASTTPDPSLGEASASVAASASPDVVATTLTSIGSGLQGPAGLAATVFATGLANVSAFAFDDDDRLWAATAGYSDDGTDAIYLIATAGATPAKVVADVHTPLGLVWSGDTLYVAETGGVVAYGGFTGSTFARHSTVITLPTGVGEVNGLASAPDGRLWLGVSAPCDACRPETAEAASVLSFLADGTDLRVEAGGIRAPVGLAFYPGSDDLFVTMNQRDDLGDTTPGDWLAVVRSGQAWGFPDCYGQGGSACDGVPAPIAVLDQHAAVSGVAIVTGQLGASVGPSALVAEWATGTVLQVRLSHDGTTWSGTVEPFLTGLSGPVPIVVAPGGVVFVGDWRSGTIYRIAAA